MDFEIKKVKIKEKRTKQAIGAKYGFIPKHPFRLYIVGASGSGKTNVLLNLLTRENMYKNYFDSILIISPTARNLDASYQVLDLDEKHYFDCDESVLENIRDIQEERSARGKAPKTLVVLDDIISFTKFCNSDILRQFAVMSRHWNVSMIILSQAYHNIPKTIRLQMSSVIYFKGSNKENKTLVEDFTPPGYSKKEFLKLINFATKIRYNFLFVDLHQPVEDRYKINFTKKLL